MTAFSVAILGILRNYDGDRQWEPKKSNSLISKQQVCSCITLIFTFLCCPCTTTTWNGKILSLLKNGNGKAINSTISVWIRARSLSSAPIKIHSCLITGRIGIIAKRLKDAKSIFQRRSHGRCRCRIVRSLLMSLGVNLGNKKELYYKNRKRYHVENLHRNLFVKDLLLDGDKTLKVLGI